MTSERARLANRLNAKKSKGPRTSVGKARSKQNARKHGLSIEGLDPQTEADIEILAGLIVEKYECDVALYEAARSAAEAQVHLQRVQAFRTALLRSGVGDGTSGIEAGQRLTSEIVLETSVQLERLDRYEARALSRRKFAFRRFLVLANR
ncbi:hypothetical protein [Methylobacterium sp. 37f]|uniref:hypothetical protein n=1 Tax=Methylobacterium sp. 37f TaxID=2817058 RepID=UPI001FFC64C4|nr:hypothetical protein [Methylobacterium sp. 37f]MCK2055489.1 hypothetical protein [Methylobacterium sp. 37f]